MPTSNVSRRLAVLLVALLSLPAFAGDVSIPKLTPPAVPLDAPVAVTAGIQAAAAVEPDALTVSAIPEAQAPSVVPAEQPAAAISAQVSAASPASEAAGGASSGAGRDAALDARFDGSRPDQAEADLAGEAEAAFAAAHPKSGTIAAAKEASRGRATFADFANAMIFDDIFSHTAGPRAMGAERVPFGYPNRDVHVKAIDEVLAFADKAGSDALAGRFVAALAKLNARRTYETARRRADFAEPLPPNPLHGGEYWDFATGPNGGRLMLGQKDSATQYRFFDQSAYVIDYLNEMKRLALADGKPVSNIDIIHADVRRMARPPTPISVIRSKNVHAYVGGFEKDLERMSDWIAPNGQLVLQNDPSAGQRHYTVKLLGPMIERLLAKGWTLRFDGFSDTDDRLETLTLTRPARDGAKPDQASKQVWKKYKQDVQELSMGGSELNALLRMLMGGR